jgi:hypothetical protein
MNGEERPRSHAPQSRYVVELRYQISVLSSCHDCLVPGRSTMRLRESKVEALDRRSRDCLTEGSDQFVHGTSCDHEQRARAKSRRSTSMEASRNKATVNQVGGS